MAEALATVCRIRFQTDFALSTVGIAGADEAHDGQPVGLVYTALAWKDGVRSAKYNWFGTRAEIASRTARMALNQLRLHLLGSPPLTPTLSPQGERE